MKILLLIFVCFTFHVAFCRDLIVCPGEPKTLLADKEIKGNLFQPIKVRFPENARYPSAISCIVVTDESFSHSDPVITQGSIGDSFVEITIGPWFLKELKYRFQIYTNA